MVQRHRRGFDSGLDPVVPSPPTRPASQRHVAPIYGPQKSYCCNVLSHEGVGGQRRHTPPHSLSHAYARMYVRPGVRLGFFPTNNISFPLLYLKFSTE